MSQDLAKKYIEMAITLLSEVTGLMSESSGPPAPPMVGRPAGKPWSPEHRAKYMATLQRKKKQPKRVATGK